MTRFDFRTLENSNIVGLNIPKEPCVPAPTRTTSEITSETTSADEDDA
jgi:hypothetical protein